MSNIKKQILNDPNESKSVVSIFCCGFEYGRLEDLAKDCSNNSMKGGTSMISESQLASKIESKKDAVEDAVDALFDAVDGVSFDRNAKVTGAALEAISDVVTAAQELSVLFNELGALKNVAKANRQRGGSVSDRRYRRVRY